MPATPHVEKHFQASEAVRDIVIGMADGLTVPFALAAGLSGAVASTGLVVTAGLAEVAAGSIAMGLGGYLAAKTDAEHYASERRREIREVEEIPEREMEEVVDVLRGYGLDEEHLQPVAQAIAADPERWVDWMMRFELNLDEPHPARARKSAMTIAGSYVVGGLVPLSAYIMFQDMSTALGVSVVVTLAALFAFGFIKGHFTGISPWKGGLQTIVTGGLAAAAAYAIAKAVA
ncbi:MAG: VIT1/CCC1 transporter family protein [candidate division Zixibacteria bacterium]|nr:VIT1/CCC1 transporter family protein [candidate division Zixibacteria bacterium]